MHFFLIGLINNVTSIGGASVGSKVSHLELFYN